MRIYVDEPIHRWRGMLWCHMFSPDVDALRTFAAQLGMKPEWFQDPHTMPKVRWPHFDVPEKRRALALRAGAVPVGKHQVSAMSKVIINRYHGLEGTERELDPLSLQRRINSPVTDKLDQWLARELAFFGIERTAPTSRITQEG